MSPQMIKFPKIPQFKQAVREVSDRARFKGLDAEGLPIFDHTPNLPVMTFMGTTKLHGTNAAIALNAAGLYVQSRTRVITPEKDNAGFAAYVYSNIGYFKDSLEDIATENEIDLEKYTVLIYGEWCGGNIQSGVAINKLEKMFVAFAARMVKTGDVEHNDHRWISPLTIHTIPEIRFFNITDFKYHLLDIDFADPDAVNSELHELTDQVEKECPVGKHFGVEKGTGEGIVWSAVYKGDLIAFKVKGEKHTTSRVKKLPVVDEVKQALVHQFVNDYACTASRMEQVFDLTMDTLNGGQPDIKKTGVFLKALVTDTMQECHNELAQLGLQVKDVTGTISRVAKEWMFRNKL